METISFQVGEVTFRGETEEGVESVATDIKGCNTSWCYHTKPVLQKKFEAVDKIYRSLLFQKQSFSAVVDRSLQNAHVQWSTLAVVYIEGLMGLLMLKKCILLVSVVAEL